VELSVLFDGTFEGFLCVVYAAYYEKISPAAIQIEGTEQLTLNEQPRYIETDDEKATRVYNAVRNKISYEAAEHIHNAFHSHEDARFMQILQYIRLGFELGHMVDSHLHEDFVRRVHTLSKNVGREAHLLYGFCRFSETKQGVYYCKVTPKNDVLTYLAAHFAQRLMNQTWVIHDKRRNKAAIYDGTSYLVTSVPASAAEISFAEGEEETQELWVAFFNTLAITERKNAKLQRQLLPLYFRPNMTEFNKK
jgi:probable DNA metabolism protein